MSVGSRCMSLFHLLIEGQVYNFNGIAFKDTDNDFFRHLWSIRSEYYGLMTDDAVVKLVEPDVVIPLCPPTFLEFGDIPVMQHNRFVGMRC